MSQNEVLFRYRSGVMPPLVSDKSIPAQDVAAAGLMNLLSLGYLPVPELTERIMKASEPDVRQWFAMVQSLIRGSTCAGQDLKPMYPNFPRQVIQMPNEEFVIRAMIHYMMDGKWIPEFEKEYREPLRFAYLRTLNLCTEDDYHQVFTNMMSSLSPLSKVDQDSLTEYLLTEPVPRIPDVIPVKETCAMVEVLLLKANKLLALKRLVRTPTDILRFAAAVSGGDVSLHTPVEFGSYPRHIRRLMLELLNRCHAPLEEMAVHRSHWLRLGESLHPGEKLMRENYMRAADAFDALRAKDIPSSFNYKAEKALMEKDTKEVLRLLGQRPGMFARQLNHVLENVKPEDVDKVLAAFHACAGKVSTRVLLQVIEFFRNRNEVPVRVFKAISRNENDYYQTNSMPVMETALCERVIRICENAIKAQLAQRPYMGRVFVSKDLETIAAPLHQRKMSDGFRILPSGSWFKLPEDVHVLRSFLHWKNAIDRDGDEMRTDVDLSVVFLDEEFNAYGTVSYFNHSLYHILSDGTREVVGVHSGDFVDAPIATGGASEFVDVDLDVASKCARYMVVSVNMYTNQSFSDMETCFGGWMGRYDMNSGEPFEPSTVETMFHLTGVRTRMPFLVDLVDRRVLWLDAAANSALANRFANNVDTLRGHFNMQVSALVGHKPLTLDYVIRLNAESRGVLVDDPAQADMIFSMDAGVTPFNHDQILSLL